MPYLNPNNRRPKGARGYGSIGHLPGSKLGPSDSTIGVKAAALLIEKTRDRHDVVYVQEKVDGSNSGVFRSGDTLYPITRAGLLASESPYPHHRRFAAWVERERARFLKLLQDGETATGECLRRAHGTLYQLKHEPFVLFDIRRKAERLTHDGLKARVGDDFVLPATVHVGGACSVEEAMKLVGSQQSDGTYGHHGALERVEGAVWRLERLGKVLLVAKFVREDTETGKYLSGKRGFFINDVEKEEDVVWNKNLEQYE